MKWVELVPVKRGDIVQMTVCGVSGRYEVLRDATDTMNLRLCDLRLVV